MARIKLYSSPVSPFAARVRVSLIHKGLEFQDLGLPECGLKGEEYLRINPMGRIPVMMLEDGTAIPESETILDYLEEVYPVPTLRLKDPVSNAAMRTAIRVLDTYVCSPLINLFPHLDATVRVMSVADCECRKFLEGLAYLNCYVDNATYAIGGRLTLADCCLVPSLWLCNVIAPQFGIQEPLSTAPRLEGYLQRARLIPLLDRVHGELVEAYEAYTH